MQQEKYSFPTLEDLSLDAQTHRKLDMVIPVCNSSHPMARREAEAGGYLGVWGPASLEYMVTNSKRICFSVKGLVPEDFQSSCVCAVACISLYSYTRTSTQRLKKIFFPEAVWLMDMIFSNNCIMSSSMMLTIHRFIHTAVGSPTELVTWKVSGGA